MADGWKPAVGARVLCTPLKDEQGVAPPGHWRILARGPGARTWWLQATDEPAREYARKYGESLCIERTSLGFTHPQLKLF